MAERRPGRSRAGQRRQSDLAILAEIGRAMTQAQLKEDDLCELIFQLAGRIVPTANFQLGLFDGTRYHIKVWVKDNQRQPAGSYTLRPGHGLVGWLRESRQPLIVADFETEMETLPARPIYISDHPPRSAIFLPLLTNEAVIGAISIQSPEPGAFDQSHLRHLSIVANQSAAALNNARLYASGQRRLQDLLVVADVGRKLTSILDLDALLTEVVELIRGRFGYYHVQVFLIEQGAQRAMFRASSGHRLNEKWRREGRSTDIIGGGIIGWVAQHAAPLVANDVAQEPRYIPDDPRLLPDTHAELAIPLLMESQVIGVLDVQSTQRDAFDADAVFILSTLADQVAVAVSSAQAYEAQRDEAWITTAMLQVADAIQRLQALDTILPQITDLAWRLAGIDRCAILLRDGADTCTVRSVRARHGALTAPFADLVVDAEVLPALAVVWQTGQPVIIDDAQADERVSAAWVERMGSRTLAVLPLVVAETPVGVLLADDVDTPHLFTPRRIRILTGIAGQAAIALEHDRLLLDAAERARLGRELELAQDIQRRLLPMQAPSADDYEIAYRWQSARQVGGDFFDFMRLAPHRLGLVIADVSDKGIPAALYMMFARTLLRAVAFSGREPAATLVRTNQLMAADSASDMFVTAYYSVLDNKTHQLTYASAGHNLAFFCPVSAPGPIPLTTRGLALGVLPAIEVEQKSIALAPGDIVLFYTDGAEDAIAVDGEAFGEARLAAVLQSHRHASAESIAAAIEAAVKTFVADQSPYDDFTLLVLKRIGPQHETAPTLLEPSSAPHAPQRVSKSSAQKAKKQPRS